MLSRTAPRLDTSTLPARPLSLAALAAGLALALVMAGCGKKVDHAEADAAASVEETANVIAMPAAAEPAYQAEPPVNLPSLKTWDSATNPNSALPVCTNWYAWAML